jgi:hypothetical protein
MEWNQPYPIPNVVEAHRFGTRIWKEIGSSGHGLAQENIARARLRCNVLTFRVPRKREITSAPTRRASKGANYLTGSSQGGGGETMGRKMTANPWPQN